MQDHFFEVTNIKVENEDSTQFSAEIKGKRWSGITEQSRYWQEIQKAIDDGAVVDPFVPHVEGYKELRQKEYPNIGDQLDAIWKQLNQDRLNGKDLITEADDLLGSILSVKAKYPKDV